VIETWSAIMNEIAESRLIMQASGLGDAATQQLVAMEFSRRGIAPDRLSFIGFTDFLTFLKLFDEIDIALDAFPYSSGTTTCHTLWMGVPVVSLVGQTGVQRMGLSVLSQIGFGELATPSVERYRQVVAELSSSTEKLSEIRRGMRERMIASPLLDGARHTKHLEQVYRTAWTRWLNGALG
jgi:predicted O-linked N-acetylglucosamine transferase (SPINDLY family)